MIRIFQPQDLPRVLDLWLSGNREAHSFLPPSHWEALVPTVRELLLQAELYVFVSQDQILGFVGLQGAYLAGLFVDGSRRGQGIGRQLLSHVKTIRPAFTLHVYQRNPRAAAFYLREGLRITAQAVDRDTQQMEYIMAWP